MAVTAVVLCAAASEALKSVGNLADCTLMYADGSGHKCIAIKVSKAIIAAHSKVLGSMLNDLSPTEGCIKLDDSLAEVACILNHAYGGQEFSIDMDNLLNCSRMARKYDMPRLQRAVDTFLKQLQLSDDNLPGWMGVAHGDPELPGLRQRCTDFAAKRLLNVQSGRVAKKQHPTDWLEKLPQSTLIELLQRRSQVLGGIVKADCNNCTAGCQRRHYAKARPLSDTDVRAYESVPLV